MEFLLLINGLILVWMAGAFVAARAMRARELGRFRLGISNVQEASLSQLDSIAAQFDIGNIEEKARTKKVSKADRDLAHKLAEAGFETPVERGRYMLFRYVAILGFPVLGATSYLVMIPYYATIVTLFSTCAGILIPMLWLKAKIQARIEDIQRELPLILDLTNLGTSAGWDLAASLERVIDALYVEYPEHPLIREFKKGRWLTASGYTWNEALERISKKLSNETVVRTMLALGQAISQGGNRSKQLDSIAEDTLKTYYSQIDKRLAALPMKVVLITMMLMVAYFIILLAPATTQLGNMLPK